MAKILNEVYRQFNASQTPMAVLEITLPTDSYDVNVTPDKRKVMLHREKALLQGLREAVEAAFDPSTHTYAVGGGVLTQARGAGLFACRFVSSSPCLSRGSRLGCEAVSSADDNPRCLWRCRRR